MSSPFGHSEGSPSPADTYAIGHLPFGFAVVKAYQAECVDVSGGKPQLLSSLRAVAPSVLRAMRCVWDLLSTM